jgi:hypothetical protein
MNNFIFFTNFILKVLFLGTLCFYTTWGLLLFVLYSLGILKNYQSSIFLILSTIFFGGMIITYYYPKKIVIPFLGKTISGRVLKIYNLVFHLIPMLFFVKMYDTKVKPDNFILAYTCLLMYLLCFNPIKVYNYDNDDNKYKKNIVSCLVISYLILVTILIIYQKNLF